MIYMVLLLVVGTVLLAICTIFPHWALADILRNIGLWQAFFYIFLVALVLGFINFLLKIDTVKKDLEMMAEREKAKQEAAKREHEEMIELDRQCKETSIQSYNRLIAEHGQPDNKIDLDSFGGALDNVLVFENDETVVLQGMSFHFEQILGYTVDDDSFTVGGDVHAVSSVSNGSVVGRSLMGKALAGREGAIIGGVTAKRRTHYVRDKETTYHDYTVNVKMDDLETPLVDLNVGEDTDTLHEVTALLDAIMHKVKMMRAKGIPTYLERQERAEKAEATEGSPVEEETARTSHKGAEEAKPAVGPSQMNGIADELLKLAQLKDSGILTEEEFNAQKKKLLNL